MTKLFLTASLSFFANRAFASSGDTALGYFVIGLVVVVTVVGLWIQAQKADDPEDKTFISLDQIVDVAELESADAYLVTYTRQSGNEFKPAETWRNSESVEDGSATINKSALSQLVTTLKRARWDGCWVLRNDYRSLVLMRPVANAGKNEGKRLATVQVIAYADSEVSASSD